MSEFDQYLAPPNLWFSELHKNEVGLTFRIKDILYSGHSKYQRIMVVDTYELGKVLILYGSIMFTEKDEYFYHEMLAHVGMFAHPNPERVLIIGGGDGGTLREVCKHPTVKHVDLVDIDSEVVRISREFFPNIASSFDDPRVTVHFEDGARFVKETDNRYDVVFVDSSDPVGPATSIFSHEFYEAIKAHLTENGLMVAQSESPFYHSQFITNLFADLKRVFPYVKMYLSWMPAYPSGMWSYAFASLGTDHLPKRSPENLNGKLRFYNPELHKAAFVLPNFVREMVE